MVDTLRADALSCSGAAREVTPRLDAFFRDEATLYENAYAASSWTLPSFGTILTGAPPSTHGADRLGAAFGALRKGIPTLAESLHARKYLTMAIVNNPFLSREFGLDRGFARYDHEATTNASGRRADEVTRKALAFAYSVGDRPFFLLAHYFDPHLDYDPPEAFRKRFLPPGTPSDWAFSVADQVAFKTGRRSPSPEEAARIRALYDAEVAFVDEQIGLLLDGFRRAGLDRHLTVIVTSDHGEEFFEHGGFEHGHSLHEEVARVPLLVRVPGRTKPGVRVAAPVSHADLAPAILSIVDGGAGPGRDLSRPETLASDADLLLEGALYGDDRAALVRGRTKWIEPPGALYDLAADPRESRDLAAAPGGEREKAARDLAAALALAREKARLAGEALGPRAEADLAPPTLRSLGIPYLEDPRRNRK